MFLDSDTSRNEFCFKTYGTTMSPQWNDNCVPWVPVFSGQVNVTNKTGQTIYVSYCTDFNWQLANGLLNSLVDNTRNGNRIAVKLFALAMAFNADLPAELYELFKKISFKVMPEGSKMVVSTDTLDTIGEIFTIIDDGAMESSLNIIAANIERDEELLTSNKEMNLIIASAGIMGGAHAQSGDLQRADGSLLAGAHGHR